jgi:hypothetical protein
VKVQKIITALKDNWDTPVVHAFVREIERTIEQHDGRVTDFGAQLIKLLRDERAAVKAGRLMKSESLRGRIEKFTRMVGFEGNAVSREAAMADTLTADGKPRKRKSKVVKLAKAAAVAGGLDWAALTKAQRRDIKDAVKRDRAARKIAKQLGVPATSASPTAGSDGRGAADPVLLKSVGVEQAALDAIKQSLRAPRSGDGWRP